MTKRPNLIIRDTGKSVTVRQVAGGWIFEWRDPSAADEYHDRQRTTGMSWPHYDKAPPTNGTEIFTDAKALTKRVSDFIA